MKTIEELEQRAEQLKAIKKLTERIKRLVDGADPYVASTAINIVQREQLEEQTTSAIVGVTAMYDADEPVEVD